MGSAEDSGSEGKVSIEALMSTAVDKADLWAVRPLLRYPLRVFEKPHITIHDMLDWLKALA